MRNQAFSKQPLNKFCALTPKHKLRVDLGKLSLFTLHAIITTVAYIAYFLSSLRNPN